MTSRSSATRTSSRPASGDELAVRAGFSTTDATVIATAISEIARNIVRFTRRAETMTVVSDRTAWSG